MSIDSEKIANINTNNAFLMFYPVVMEYFTMQIKLTEKKFYHTKYFTIIVLIFKK